METLVRVHRKSLRALVGWQVVWASLLPPTKIWVLTPPGIISFGVWRIEGLPLVIKSISDSCHSRGAGINKIYT